jgi:hypothetical protein
MFFSMTKDEIKDALLLAFDRGLECMVETPWTILIFAAWTLGAVIVGFVIGAL